MWRHLAASVQGASHVRNGVPCQDFSVVTEIGERGLLLACSDGAGSAARADAGAETACRALVDAVHGFTAAGGRIDTLTMDTATTWLDAVRAAIQSRADAESLPTREFACTLVAALVGEASSAFLQIGDGAIVAAAAAAASEVVFWPEQGEYANTTYFVTGPDAHQRLRLDVRPTPVHDVALFTDGLQHIALRYETRVPHQPFFDPMFARLRADDAWPGLGSALASFLGSEAISTRTDDDCTLVLACRCPQPGP
jgi:protein phosphatase 2C-like protein